MRSVGAITASLDCPPVAEQTLKLILEYDGSGFRGWARQPQERTIEGVVRGALDLVFPVWSGLAVAGRTDTGVHATGQVVSVRAAGGCGRLPFPMAVMVYLPWRGIPMFSAPPPTDWMSKARC